MHPPAGNGPVCESKTGEPGNRSHDQRANDDRKEQGPDQGGRINEEQGHEVRHGSAKRLHLAAELGDDEGAKPVIQIEKQRERPWIADKGSEQACQQVAAAQIGHEETDKQMKPDKGSKGHRDAPGSPDGNRQCRSGHALDPLDDIGEQPSKAAIRPDNAANPVNPRQLFAALEHSGFRADRLT